LSRDQQPKSQGVLSYLFDELRGAIQDIRQKVVEEGWFGRVVTAAPVVEVDHALGRERGGLYSDDHRPLAASDSAEPELRPSFEDLWKPHSPGEHASEVTKDHGIDYDR
jgi:hypothetical protein